MLGKYPKELRYTGEALRSISRGFILFRADLGWVNWQLVGAFFMSHFNGAGSSRVTVEGNAVFGNAGIEVSGKDKYGGLRLKLQGVSWIV